MAKALEFLIGPDNTYMTGCGLDISVASSSPDDPLKTNLLRESEA